MKLLEDKLQFRRRNTYSRIGHADTHPPPTILRNKVRTAGVGNHGCIHRDGAVIGSKFDRIRKEIEEHLPDSPLIHADRA